MIEEKETMINKLYQKAYDKPLQVYEVFKDYFDEERVDIQNIKSVSEFKSYIKEVTYARYISRIQITNSARFLSYDEVTQGIIKALLSEGALHDYIAGDYTVFKYLFPFLYDVFALAFREANILVHFPEVRVTNEHDKFIDIKDLYAKVRVKNNGTIAGTFTLGRTDYPVSHLRFRYMHSHIPNTGYPNFDFESPCLGRGPINNTILSLTTECDLNLWMLFCHELNTYVKVESLSGGPYIRLETVTSSELTQGPTRFSPSPKNIKTLITEGLYNTIIRDYLKFIIDAGIIKFNYSGGSYNLAMNYLDFIIALSNAFIHFINHKMKRNEINLSMANLTSLLTNNVLRYCIIKDKKIYYLNSPGNIIKYLKHDGDDAFIFKGKMLKMHIYDDTPTENTENMVLILSPYICESILYHMITYLNSVYGTKKLYSEIGTFKKFFIV